MPPSPPATDAPYAASALSGHLDTRTAAIEVAHMLHDAVGRASDLLMVFASFHHRAALPEGMETIRQTLGPRVALGITAESVLGDDEELEGVAGLSAIAMQLPGVTLTPWCSTPDWPIPLRDPDEAAQRIGLTDDHRGTVLLGDPFSTPISRLLPALVDCGPTRPVPIYGGMVSGASQPNNNVMVLDDQVLTQGAIGVSIAGDVSIDHVVSQGCRPIGAPHVVTKAKTNLLLELGGRPALKVVQETMSEMPTDERELLEKGLLIGSAIDEGKRPLGRGDFLVRNVLGFDQKRDAVVCGEIPRVGQTVQLHVRDRVTAAEDLQLLLDAQQLHEPPFASLLFTCNGRGQRLFGEPSHDLSIIRSRLGRIPIAGFLAAGEIGPVGDRSYLHGHTAALMLLRRYRGSV